MADRNIVVLGAGVIGLTTALVLSKKQNYKVTVVAKHMPGDLDIEYASPWAGACYLPFSEEGSLGAQLEQDTWPELARLAGDLPEAGMHFERAVLYSRDKDASTDIGQWQKELHNIRAWWKSTVPNFKTFSKSELPPGYDSGLTFTTVNINPSIYLPWLASQCLKQGVTLKRAVVDHVTQAALLHTGGKADVVVNCTGLSSRKLGGVMDNKLTPARGQTILVREEPGMMLGTSGTDDGPDEAVYLITRSGGGGCVLGGSYQLGNWESQPDPNLANRILKRATELWAAANGGKAPSSLSIVRHGVGLRPVREGGPRIENETINGVEVVHCYGHGGAGYENSYGSVKIVERLVEKAFVASNGT